MVRAHPHHALMPELGAPEGNCPRERALPFPAAALCRFAPTAPVSVTQGGLALASSRQHQVSEALVVSTCRCFVHCVDRILLCVPQVTLVIPTLD